MLSKYVIKICVIIILMPSARIIFGSHVRAEGALKVCVYLRAMKRDNRIIILMPSVSEAEENVQILGRT